jgi:hypothetical protein
MPRTAGTGASNTSIALGYARIKSRERESTMAVAYSLETVSVDW